MNITFRMVAVQPDGKIVIGGIATDLRLHLRRGAAGASRQGHAATTRTRLGRA